MSTPTFAELGLPPPLLEGLSAVGYETPSPIQAGIIPELLAGRDVLGQAQTGTGKTAAFALPLLARLDLSIAAPQILVLTPTRELTIQVAEAFQRYAAKLPGFHVLPVYGGQGYELQLRPLKRGVHAVVGTPGRVMDHLRRGSLKLDRLQTLVLDEADEMLRMGFIDDVEWILEQTPAQRQVALFSATMPSAIRRIAQGHLKDPAEVSIKVQPGSQPLIRQRAWLVSGMHKLDALTRIMEGEPYDAMMIFARTKIATVELADKLQARGHAAVAINGDIDQKQRERTVEMLRKGSLDILVATDVVARGIDVERVSHVINYDIPHDTESYVHRIGRTGRAGRSGDAILFVAPRERRMLAAIERATRQRITLMELPSIESINESRVERFLEGISTTLDAGQGVGFFRDLIARYIEQTGADPLDVAAALARRLQGDVPLLLDDRLAKKKKAKKEVREALAETPAPRKPKPAEPAAEFETFRLEVGRDHGAQPGNIIGAIANEAGLDAQFIGRLQMEAEHSTIELPVGMPRELFRSLKRVWVSGRQLQISRPGGDPAADTRGAAKKKKAAPRKGKNQRRKERSQRPTD